MDLEAVFEYNRNVLALDPLYASVHPLNGYIVRVFLNEPTVTDSGLLIPFRQMVAIPTQNGMADYAEIETPIPYANKAVIVSTPPHSQFLKVGDIVQLGNNPVRTQAAGKGKNASVSIPAAYMHPEAKTIEIPTEINNQHYGYLLVSLQDILVKLND
jgi:hypothetical protein